MYVHNIIYVSNHKGGVCMSFADNLKRARKERNLSQEELAELLNVSRQAVSARSRFSRSRKTFIVIK